MTTEISTPNTTETLITPTEEKTMTTITPPETAGIPFDTIETNVELTEEQIEKLNPIVDSMDDLLEKAGVPMAYDAATKNAAIYAIGKLLIDVKNILTAKQEFGTWLQDFIKGKNKFKVSVKTLRRWRFLAEFGSFEECELVGFTNVYRLSGDKYAEAKAEVKSLLAKDYDDEFKPLVKKKVRKTVTNRFHELQAAAKKDKAATVKDLEAKIVSLKLQLAEQSHAA